MPPFGLHCLGDAMTAPVVTLNCTVGEIEELLVKGVPVEQIARLLQEPRQNVVAVWDRWRKNNGTAAASTPTVVPVSLVPSTPTTTLPGHRVDEARITVEALAAAAGRSASKRTQALGVRLADLARVVRDRLAEERVAAEKTEAAKAEQEQARADVARLEAQLRAAKAKLRVRPAGGGSTPMQREAKPAAAKARTIVDQQLACRKGCGRTSPNPQGRAAHERHCTAGAS